MQMLALVWGILAIIGFVVGFIPCLGALNWINIPFAVVGCLVSIYAINSTPQGERGMVAVALILNLIAVIIGFLRLKAGAFIL